MNPLDLAKVIEQRLFFIYVAFYSHGSAARRDVLCPMIWFSIFFDQGPPKFQLGKRDSTFFFCFIFDHIGFEQRRQNLRLFVSYLPLLADVSNSTSFSNSFPKYPILQFLALNSSILGNSVSKHFHYLISYKLWLSTMYIFS